MKTGNSASAEDWSHWRGTQRNGATSEVSGWTGEDWSAQHSQAVWQSKVGFGASSPLVIDGKVYVAGWSKENDTLRCLDLKTGRELWSQSYASPKYGRHAVGDQGFFLGTTATPEYDADSGQLFTLSSDGRLSAWNLADGRPLWNLNLYDDYGIERRPQITERKNTRRDYGYTTAPLIFGDWVIVEAGDPKSGNLMAFRKSDGQRAWTSQNRDVAGHSGGPNLLTVDGVPCAVVATSFHVLVVRLDGANAGKTVAEYPWRTDFSNTIASAAPHQPTQSVLITSRYNQNAMVRLDLSIDGGAREAWRNSHPSGVCTPVIYKDRIYFANKGIYCIDFESGKLLWEGGRVSDAGSCVITGDERLVVWANAGDLTLADSAVQSPDECNILAERRAVFNDMAWPHVVLADGHLLVKTVGGDLAAFEIGAK